MIHQYLDRATVLEYCLPPHWIAVQGWVDQRDGVNTCKEGEGGGGSYR